MKDNKKGEVTVNEFRKEIGSEGYDELNGWHFKIRFNDGSREVKLNPSTFARNEELKEIILDASEEIAE